MGELANSLESGESYLPRLSKVELRSTRFWVPVLTMESMGVPIEMGDIRMKQVAVWHFDKGQNLVFVESAA
jgi:hypothetical protein